MKSTSGVPELRDRGRPGEEVWREIVGITWAVSRELVTWPYVGIFREMDGL